MKIKGLTIHKSKKYFLFRTIELVGILVQQSLAVTLPPVKLFSQQCYFELGPKKLELSYFSHSNAIFPPPVTLENSVTGGKNSVTEGKIT